MEDDNTIEENKHSRLNRAYSSDKQIKRAKILDKKNLDEK